MDDSQYCPTCGGEIASDGGIGICSRCAIDSVLESHLELEQSKDVHDIRIGPYQINGLLGEGGCGTVYRARQTEPFARDVALKILRKEVAGQKMVERFELERAVLGRLNHKGICKIYDAGETELGRPYFAMELIDGAPITKFPRMPELSLEELLRLFQDACESVHHAHQRGIIHRDIKPSNMLVVDEQRSVRAVIIDFGIAKAMEPITSSDTLLTNPYQILGTPAYMSPEQARSSGGEADVRSDIYALGVVLYELLTGTTPILDGVDGNADLGKMLRNITEVEPVKPSVRLHKTQTPDDEVRLVALPRQIRGDLDWIVLKALEKNPDLRYQSALEFREDIDRFLNNRPIEARPPKLTYRLKKFARRNRVMVVAFTVAMVVAIAFWIHGAVARSQEADRQFVQLMAAETDAVSFILPDLQLYKHQLRDRLRTVVDSPEAPFRDRLHGCLALTWLHGERVDDLANFLLNEPAAAASLFPIQSVLAGQSIPEENVKEAWKRLFNKRLPHRQRLRAATLLAVSEPRHDNWRRVASDVASMAAQDGPAQASRWSPLLKPVVDYLESDLRAVYLDEAPTPAGAGAALLLARHHKNDLSELMNLARTAHPNQFHPIAESFLAHPGAEILLGEEVLRKLPEGESEGDKEALAEAQARAGFFLMEIGSPDKVWEALRLPENGMFDPRVRTKLIHGFAEYGIEPILFEESVRSEMAASVRAAILLSLGTYDERGITQAERELLLPNLLELSKTDPDSEVHGACEWLLKKWGFRKELAEALAAIPRGDVNSDRDWFIDKIGMTMIRISPPGKFPMGSPKSEPDRDDNEFQHDEELHYSYAISSRVMTLGQLRSIAPEIEYFRTEKKGAELPVLYLTRPMVRMLCNRVSLLEGIPQEQWAYESEEPYLPKSNLEKLSGYRLPNEVEWEYAMRGRAHTSRPYGHDPELLSEYACWTEDSNQTEPGLRRPNCFGIFDALGNTFEFIDSFYRPYPGSSSLTTGQSDSRQQLKKELDQEEEYLVRSQTGKLKKIHYRVALRLGSPTKATIRASQISVRLVRTLSAGP